jgi:hypothetical protein
MRLLYSQHSLGANAEVFDEMRVQLVDVREALPVLPKELDQPQLCEHSRDLCGALFRDQHPVHAAPENLHGLGQVGRVWERDEWLLLVAHLLDVSERYGLPLPSLLGELVERGDIFFVGVCEAEYEEEVSVQVAVVERAGRVSRVLAVAEQDDVGCALFYQNLHMSEHAFQEMTARTHTRGVLDARVVLDELDQAGIHHLAQLDAPPVASVESRVAALCRRIIQQVLESLLRERRLPRRARGARCCAHLFGEATAVGAVVWAGGHFEGCWRRAAD